MPLDDLPWDTDTSTNFPETSRQYCFLTVPKLLEQYWTVGEESVETLLHRLRNILNKKTQPTDATISLPPLLPCFIGSKAPRTKPISEPLLKCCFLIDDARKDSEMLLHHYWKEGGENIDQLINKLRELITCV